MQKPLYKPFKSKNPNKKMSVYVMKNGKKTLIHFGDKNFNHNYSKKARESYDKRSKGIRDKNGKLTYKDKNSANYYARRYLWRLKN
jgi:hypothetical protein